VFDASCLSSDGGLALLNEIASRLGLAQAIAACLRDERDPTRIRRCYGEMALAGTLMIAAGYEDCDYIDDTDDPVHGQQELALFNAHYDCTCFQPIPVFDALPASRRCRCCGPAPTLGRRGGQGSAPRHPPHPQALAHCSNPGALRQPLSQ
jgi:hypothetical protein